MISAYKLACFLDDSHYVEYDTKHNVVFSWNGDRTIYMINLETGEENDFTTEKELSTVIKRIHEAIFFFETGKMQKEGYWK